MSNKRGKARLGLSSDNQGDTRLPQRHGDVPVSPKHKEGPMTNIILLDDILPFLDFRRAVIKIDIQGFEHRAMLGGSKLLDEMYIPYIIMEWVFMRSYYVSESHDSEDKQLVVQMIDMLTSREYIPCSVEGHSLLYKSWKDWDYDIVWVHKDMYKH